MVSTVLQLAAILGFPLVVFACVAYLAWGDLRRPWLYFGVTTGVLYFVDWLIFVYLGETITGLFAVARGDAARAADSRFSGFVLFKLYAKPLLGFAAQLACMQCGWLVGEHVETRIVDHRTRYQHAASLAWVLTNRGDRRPMRGGVEYSAQMPFKVRSGDAYG